jgi:hypothetical protein
LLDLSFGEAVEVVANCSYRVTLLEGYSVVDEDVRSLRMVTHVQSMKSSFGWLEF